VEHELICEHGLICEHELICEHGLICTLSCSMGALVQGFGLWRALHSIS
jgi:hypothetical protein